MSAEFQMLYPYANHAGCDDYQRSCFYGRISNTATIERSSSRRTRHGLRNLAACQLVKIA